MCIPKQREVHFRHRILLKGISASTSEDNLSHFLEEGTGVKAIRLAYHKSDDTIAVIEMESKPGMYYLKMNFNTVMMFSVSYDE